MSVLRGREWFSWEILDLVGTAARKAMARYTELLDYVSDAETAKWRDAALSLAMLKTQLNQAADADAKATNPQRYQQGSELWNRVDAALSPVAGDPDILATVARLPVSSVLAASPSTLAPVLLGLLAIAAAGYYYVRSK